MEAGERAAGARVGSGARPVGLLLGAAGTECLCSSLLMPWKTSPAAQMESCVNSASHTHMHDPLHSGFSPNLLSKYVQSIGNLKE